MKTTRQTMTFWTNSLLLGLTLLGQTYLTYAGAANSDQAELIRPQFLLAAPHAFAPAVTRLAAQTQVQILEQRGGWKRVRTQGHEGWLRLLALRQARQSGSLGQSFLSRNQPGQPNTTRVTSVAGIRSISQSDLPPDRATAHALILTIADYRNGILRLPGVAYDADNAVLMARALNVPGANITTLNNAALTLAGLRTALDGLESRAQPNDEVFLYFAGHGIRQSAAQAGAPCCAEALLSVDGAALPARELTERLGRIAAKVHRVVTFIDLAFTDSALIDSALIDSSKTGATLANTASDTLTRGLVSLAQGSGKFNSVVFSAAQTGEHTLDDETRGGVASLAWLDCLAGAADDQDRSGGLSAQEIQICAQTRIEPAAPGQHPQQLSLSGNARLVLAKPLSKSQATPETPPDRIDSAAVLHDIHANRDARRQVRLTPDKPAYAVGKDRIRFSLASSHPGYVYLLMAGSDGKQFDLLFPNKKDDRNLIKANETWNLPRPGWAFRASGPAGRDQLLVLVSDQPRDFSALGLQPAGPFSSLVTSPISARNLQIVSGGDAQALPTECLDHAEAAECSNLYGADLIELIETE